MKSFHVLLFPVFIAASVHADVLSEVSPFLGSSRPDFNPASIEPEQAVENPDYAPFSPADSDLGVQQILGAYRGLPPVKVTFDTSVNYTDNAPGGIPFFDDPSWFSASQLAVSCVMRLNSGSLVAVAACAYTRSSSALSYSIFSKCGIIQY